MKLKMAPYSHEFYIATCIYHLGSIFVKVKYKKKKKKCWRHSTLALIPGMMDCKSYKQGAKSEWVFTFSSKFKSDGSTRKWNQSSSSPVGATKLWSVADGLLSGRGLAMNLKGCGMVSWLVLVSPCFRENVVATCKIGYFFVKFR